VNVYDFDKTIYRGDSTLDFYKCILKKNPKVIKYIFIQIIFAIRYIIKNIDKTRFKEKFYIFLKCIDNVDEEVLVFWEKNEKKIEEWYVEKHRSTDVVISASPEFLLKPICDKLGIKFLMASIVNKNTGEYTGKNCYGKEKVLRYRKEFDNEKIDEFYSDSLSDLPLKEISNKSFLIKNGKITNWN